MNLLGIDYGKKRIGLAWAESDIGVALPFGVWNMDHGIWSKLAKLVKDEQIDTIVVGLPRGLDGKENENTQRVREFVDELKKAVSVPIEFIDERFTTAEANKLEGDASVDEKAAMLILEAHLNKWSGD